MHHATIFGTVEHEKINTQQIEKYANIFGTPSHENIKAQREKYQPYESNIEDVGMLIFADLNTFLGRQCRFPSI